MNASNAYGSNDYCWILIFICLENATSWTRNVDEMPNDYCIFNIRMRLVHHMYESDASNTYLNQTDCRNIGSMQSTKKYHSQITHSECKCIFDVCALGNFGFGTIFTLSLWLLLCIIWSICILCTNRSYPPCMIQTIISHTHTIYPRKTQALFGVNFGHKLVTTEMKKNKGVKRKIII